MVDYLDASQEPLLFLLAFPFKVQETQPELVLLGGFSLLSIRLPMKVFRGLGYMYPIFPSNSSAGLVGLCRATQDRAHTSSR